MEQVLSRSMSAGIARNPQISLNKSNSLFLNSRPHVTDDVKIRVKTKNRNSAMARRKAYDQLRQQTLTNPDTSDREQNIYRRSKVGETVEIHRPDPPRTRGQQTDFFSEGDFYPVPEELERAIQPAMTTPRTENLLEQILGPTPVREPPPEAIVQAVRNSALEDVATVGKAIGDAIVQGIYTSERQRLSSPRESAKQLSAPVETQIQSKPTYSTDIGRARLIPDNPIRVNRHPPQKTASEELKKHLRSVSQAKSNLDQNFMYLEEDLVRNDDQRDSAVANMMRGIVDQVQLMPNGELQSSVKAIRKNEAGSATKLKSPEAEPVGKSKKRGENDMTMLKYIQQNFIPKSTMQSVAHLRKDTTAAPQTVPLAQPSSERTHAPITQQFPETKYIPRATALSEPALTPIYAAPTSRTLSAPTIPPPQLQRQNLQQSAPPETRRAPVSLRTEILPTIHIDAMPMTVETTDYPDPDPVHISAPGNVENAMPEGTFDEVYKTAMEFVEREVTAGITERLVKQHLEEQERLLEAQKPPDIEGALEKALKDMIDRLALEQRQLQKPATPEPITDEASEYTVIGTPSMTPTASPRRSPQMSPKNSIMASFRHSIQEPIPEELSEDGESVRTVPEFEGMSIQILEPEEIEEHVPMPSAAVHAIVEEENEDTRATTTAMPTTVKEPTELSISLNSEDEESQPTFTPLTEESEITPTISYGQLLIEPGELKPGTTAYKQVMPKIFEEEPGQVGAKYQPEIDYLRKHVVDHSSDEPPPKPTKRRIHTYSMDTINDENESLPDDNEPAQNRALGDSAEATKSISEGEMIFNRKFQKWRSQASSRVSSNSFDAFSNASSDRS